MQNRELWHVSGIILDETYFQAQLTAAGGQRARILERFEKGQGSMKRVALLNMIIVSFFLLSLTIIPLSALGTASKVMVDSENIYNVAFILSFGVASYYISCFIILLVFGLFQLIELVHGDNFALTATLPLTRSDLSRLGIFVYMRLYWGQFIVLLLAFPLASLMITDNHLFPVILIVNSINVVFMFYTLVLVAHFVGGRIFRSEVTSKIRTITRILFVLFYMLIIFNISGLFAAIPSFLVDLYGTELFFDPVLGALVNIILSLMVFPFSGGFLITVTFFLSIFFNYELGIVFSTLIGFLGLVVATSLVTRKGNQVLQKLGRFDYSMGSHGDREIASVQIKSNHPVVGYMRVSLVLATRNYAGLFALLSPIVFALLILATGFSFSSFSRTLDPFSVILIYSGFLPLIMKNGIFATEESLGGLLSSLPISQREIFRARQILLSMILNTSIPVIWIFQSLAGASLFLSSGLSVIFVNIIATTGFLYCHSLLFGRMNKQFTVFTVSTTHTVLKNFLLVILTNGIILFGLLWGGFVSAVLERTIFAFSITGALLGYLSFLIFAEFLLRRMFPLPKRF
ncbi:MAG: hypothetical protein ACFFE8_09330 [Candidatus Heimdallarchaeota archaeon]